MTIHTCEGKVCGGLVAVCEVQYKVGELKTEGERLFYCQIVHINHICFMLFSSLCEFNKPRCNVVDGGEGEGFFY